MRNTKFLCLGIVNMKAMSIVFMGIFLLGMIAEKEIKVKFLYGLLFILMFGTVLILTGGINV